VYLKELASARVDYVDKKQDTWTAGMQNIPLVYGDSMLGSEKWVKYRSDSEREDRQQAEQEAHGGADERMSEVE